MHGPHNIPPMHPLTGDELIDFADNWRIAQFNAEYGKSYNTPTHTSGSKVSPLSIKIILAIILVLGPLCGFYLLVGGIIFAITDNALISALIPITLIIASIVLAVVLVIKHFRKK